MLRAFAGDAWTIEQQEFDAANHQVFESLFSLGNGNFGGRGTHEEQYSGDSLQGNYVAGVYYPDPTRVGWWKNGYPDYFAKVLNAADWTPIGVEIDGEPLDLATARIDSYRRRLHLRTGELERVFRATLASGRTVEVESLKFISMADPDLAAIRYRIAVIDNPAVVRLDIGIDGDVTNEDSNHEAGFWDPVDTKVDGTRGLVVLETKKTGFIVGTGFDHVVTVEGAAATAEPRPQQTTTSVSVGHEFAVEPRQVIEVVKFAANISSRTHAPDQIPSAIDAVLDHAVAQGFDALRQAHHEAWERKWEACDVAIGGDEPVQQGVRFSIFQLQSTFTGVDPDLNIGPKGFTGEKYGGVTYWDTEAFCLPFYLLAADQDVSKNLLRYRYRQLDRAIENAEKLGFSGGAALYPMVTINGEECHNEWEITFEEIHRNGAIAFAVFNYLRTTGDTHYLLEGGLEVLVSIARFWAQRVSYSEPKQAWVMLGVTGPNEYENNVNNNWYTNLMAQWTLRYAAEAIDLARSIDGDETDRLLASLSFDEAAERPVWADVAERIHLPFDAERGVFLQQDGFLDKELRPADSLDPAERPISHHWSWDRILRSCFIKQADVLQGMWVFEDRFDLDTLRANFDFYEPMTVHESSLSPAVHAVLAVRLGRLDKANEMLRRSARLDLDDINADTSDGCHITSMAGTWIGAVLGFGGVRCRRRARPRSRAGTGWTSLEFRVHFRGVWLAVAATAEATEITSLGEHSVAIRAHGERHDLGPGASLRLAH
ncbi:MAG: family 65 glycosyl hydrolase domain-containing protein [Acidimicrobiales bacterium]